MNSKTLIQHATVNIKQIRKPYKKGSMLDAATLESLTALLKQVGFSPDALRQDELIEYLHCIQDQYHCLEERFLTALAHLLKLSRAQVYEVASFYHHFTPIASEQTKPQPLTLRICQSITCQMFGGQALLLQLQKKHSASLNIQAVPCIGTCDSAPSAVLGQNHIGQATLQKIEHAINHKHITAEISPYLGYQGYRQQGGYRFAESVYRGEVNAENIIATLKSANLKGLGGAGFSTGTKWDIVRQQPEPRYLVVNLDEGEPGTLKDGFYLHRNPHQFLEGLLIAAKVIDCQDIYIYIRDEYPAGRTILQREIKSLQSHPLLAHLNIHLRRGAGAYICGEESALIESLEGKRGMPRLRPPFVANVGLFNRPTLVNNFETLYWIPVILDGDNPCFKRAIQPSPVRIQAHSESPSPLPIQQLRSYSVSGRVKKPGVVLAPNTTTAQTLIDDYCGGMLDGHEFYGYFPGGASGGMLPARLGHLPLDFGTLQEYGCFIGSAAVIVFSQHDRARDLAQIALQFFKSESCGQCTPCRVGTAKMVDLMQQPQWDNALLNELATVMQDTSICGLGQAAANPMLSVIRYFADELQLKD